jgi:conjugative transfer signal peptidase TraF
MARRRLYVATSFSMPRGLYWRMALAPNQPLQRGHIVLFPVPESLQVVLRQVAPELAGVPLMKPVAAVDGDTVCLEGEAVRVNGQRVADRVRTTRQGRALPWPEECWTLDATTFFPLSLRHSSAVDGRYFGLVPVSSIQGRLIPLLTWEGAP